MRRYKYPIAVMLMFGFCLALTLLFRHLGLSPPWFLSLALLLSAILADYISTVIASRLGAKEANPIVNLLFSKVGVERGGLIVIAIFIGIILSMWRILPPYKQLAIACTYVIVPINNLLVIRKHKISRR